MKVKKISKSFQNSQILKDVSFEIHSGQTFHMKGPNGSGKSTIFKIIIGLLEADSGEIELEDGDYIGALIENPGLLESYSGFTNLKFLAGFKNFISDEEIRGHMEKFGLDPSAKIAVKKYSLGMKQKLGIIQAIMEHQNIILLDEPTRGLDEASIVVFDETINSLRNHGAQIIIASHEEHPAILFDHTIDLGK
ncbi:MAG: ABC transporter ATP-binding protein [Lactococcus hircilactis]